VLPRSIVVFKGPTSKWKGEEDRKGRERGREGRGGGVRNGRRERPMNIVKPR